MEALEELEDVLVTRCPLVHAGLRPGLSEHQIDRLMRPLAPLVLPLDLRAGIGIALAIWTALDRHEAARNPQSADEIPPHNRRPRS